MQFTARSFTGLTIFVVSARLESKSQNGYYFAVSRDMRYMLEMLLDGAPQAVRPCDMREDDVAIGEMESPLAHLGEGEARLRVWRRVEAR
jgi:hypothetical protein